MSFAAQNEIELLGIVRVTRIGNAAPLQEKTHPHRVVVGRRILVYQHGIGIAPGKNSGTPRLASSQGEKEPRERLRHEGGDQPEFPLSPLEGKVPMWNRLELVFQVFHAVPGLSD